MELSEINKAYGIASAEEWAKKTEARRIEMVRAGNVTTEQLEECLRNESPTLRAAYRAAYREHFEEQRRRIEEDLENVRAEWVALAIKALPELGIAEKASLDEMFEALKSARPNWRFIEKRDDGEVEWEINTNTPFRILWLAFHQEVEQRLGRPKQGLKKRNGLTSPLPKAMPQQTWPEARNMAIALADGPAGRGWQDIVGEIALRHVREDDPIQIKLVAGPSIDWWGMPATYELLRDELREAGVDAALLLNEVLYLALTRPSHMIPLDNFIESIGWDPRSVADKKECRRWIWRKLSLFENMLATGQRRGMYPHPDTKKKVPVAIVDRLVILGPRLMPEQQAFDNSEPPFEISFKPGEHLEQYRGNRKVLTDYGDVRRIAEIPAKQVSGRWARGIGLTLNQLWRQQSKNAEVCYGGEQNKLTARYKPFTRRQLLTEYFIADPPVQSILNGPNPKRAREYWDGAIKHLKRKCIIGYYESAGTTRENDKNAWLDQPLDIRPTIDGLKATKEIARAKTRISHKRARKSDASS